MSRRARQRVRVGEHSLAVEIAGEGPPLLLVHGFTGSARTWDAVRPRLAARLRTLAVDLPGHGDSDAPHDPAAYRFECVVDDLARVLDACGTSRAHVLGYSMGGRLALGLAAAHPGRVRSLVLVGASAGLADPAARAARRASDEALAESIERDGLPAFVDRWMAHPLFATQDRLGRAFLARARADRMRCAPHGLAHTLRGLGTGAQPPLHAALPGLRVPTLLVAGALDPKFRAIAGELARALPDARVLVVPAAGHAAHLEVPAAVANAVLDFLADRPPGPDRAALPFTERRSHP